MTYQLHRFYLLAPQVRLGQVDCLEYNKGYKRTLLNDCPECNRSNTLSDALQRIFSCLDRRDFSEIFSCWPRGLKNLQGCWLVHPGILASVKLIYRSIPRIISGNFLSQAIRTPSSPKSDFGLLKELLKMCIAKYRQNLAILLIVQFLLFMLKMCTLLIFIISLRNLYFRNVHFKLLLPFNYIAMDLVSCDTSDRIHGARAVCYSYYMLVSQPRRTNSWSQALHRVSPSLKLSPCVTSITCQSVYLARRIHRARQSSKLGGVPIQACMSKMFFFI